MDKRCCICKEPGPQYRLSQNMAVTMRYDGPQYALWICGKERCLNNAIEIIVAITSMGPEIAFGLVEEE